VITKQDAIATHLHCYAIVPSFPYTLRDSMAELSDSGLWDPHANIPSDTHAERHPTLPHQEVWVLTKKTLTETQKATRTLRHISNQEKFFTDNRPRNTPHHAAWRACHPCEETCCECRIPPEACPAVVSFQEEVRSLFAECRATS